MVGVVGGDEDDTEKEILLDEDSREKEEDNDCKLEEEPDEGDGVVDWMGGQESPRCDVVFVKLLRWMEKDVTSTQMTGALSRLLNADWALGLVRAGVSMLPIIPSRLHDI